VLIYKVAQFNIAQLITQREKVSSLVRENMVKKAAYFNIVLDDVSLTNITFSNEFTAAVEAKQVGIVQVRLILNSSTGSTES
jgi:prohibitin 2